MIEDPYRVLGIPLNATEETIKKAYRLKAKQYHPDFHPNDPDAAKKMNDINEAYDMLTNPDKYAARRAQQQQQEQTRKSQNTYSQHASSYTSSKGGWSSDFGFDFADFFGFNNTNQYDTLPKHEAGASAEIRSAIDAINARRFTNAINILSSILSMHRNARWHYLIAVAYKGDGNSTRAIDMLTKAVQMDPQKKMYQQLLLTYKNSERTYENTTVNGNPLRRISKFITLFFLIQFLLGMLTMCFPSGNTRYYYYQIPNKGGYYYEQNNRN